MMLIFIYAIVHQKVWADILSVGMRKLVIVIPTYNEVENIQSLIKKLKKEFITLPKWNPQILVVDGNSPDGTGVIIKKIRAKNVHLLTEKQKKGLGAAYLLGMKHAFDKLKTNLVITMDADLSHNPSYLPKFLKKFENGADFIIGSRYIKGGSIPKNWPVHRKFLSIFGNLTTQFLLGNRSLQDWTSGYRAIKKEVFIKVYPLMESDAAFKGYTFNISFAHHTVRAGFKTVQVPINFIDRKAGKSKLGMEYLFHTPVFLFKTRLREILHI